MPVQHTHSHTHTHMTHALRELRLRSREFGLPQSRSRLYILMVRKDLADTGQISGLVHVVTQALPSQLGQSSVQEVKEYVKTVPLGGLLHPPKSKDCSWSRGELATWRVPVIGDGPLRNGFQGLPKQGL